MRRVTLRFYGALEDFLPPERRGVSFVHAFPGHPSVKDLIESLGPPHPEVELVLADGVPVGFDHRVEHGQRLAVYPPFSGLDVSSLPRVGPPPLPEPRFVLDVGLGRLAGLLRMLGFDTLWRNDFADAELARVSRAERRMLLTRDLGLLKRSEVTHGYYPRETEPFRQLVEVARRFHLSAHLRPFSRCLSCNTPLVGASPQAVRERVPPRVQASYSRFLQCPSCLRVFWEGSHFARMEALVARLRAQEARG
jgi:uncharacterized protein with PIN domain